MREGFGESRCQDARREEPLEAQASVMGAGIALLWTETRALRTSSSPSRPITHASGTRGVDVWADRGLGVGIGMNS